MSRREYLVLSATVKKHHLVGEVAGEERMF